MEDYIGLVISVENYHDSENISKVLYATNDATTFINSFLNLGCAESKFIHLSDNFATKTSILEKVKDISRNALQHETIIFYFAGHGFFSNSKNLISSVDTTLASIDRTTIEIQTILSELDKSKSKRVIAFLDCCHSGIEFSKDERNPISDFKIDDLKYEYNDAEHLSVFASCKSDEKSQCDSEREHGVWSYYLIQALNGNAKIHENGILFSDKLQKYLGEETQQRVRLITKSKKNQTPIKYGKETKDRFIIADLNSLLKKLEIEHKTDGIKFEEATIQAYEEDWVRNLPGFESNHKPPKKIDNYHESYIKKISSQLIEDELNLIADSLKKNLNYKRKNIQEPIVEDGSGQLSTIDFDYIISITQSSSKADKFIIKRSIENFRNTDILNNVSFNTMFKSSFNELEFKLNKKLNVENIIDKIEEIDNEDLISVEYKSTDTSRCNINIKDFNGQIILSEYLFCIQMNNRTSPQNLVLSSQNAIKSIEQKGIQKLIT